MKAQTYPSIIGQFRGSWIFAKVRTLLVAAAFVVGATTAMASDPICVFALVDKVVLEPNETAPERIQIWGAFAVAVRSDRDAYQAPQKGYLYYTLPPEKADVARKEWSDIKKVAGTHEVIGFGSRYESKATVRKADAKATNPEPYVLGWGMAKMSQRSADYPPIKALLATKATASK
jgi:hypothetical protein